MANFELAFGKDLALSARLSVSPAGITVVSEGNTTFHRSFAESIALSNRALSFESRIAATLSEFPHRSAVSLDRSENDAELLTMEMRWVVEHWIAFRELRAKVPPLAVNDQTTNVLLLELYDGKPVYEAGDYKRATMLFFVSGNLYKPEQAQARMCPGLEWCLTQIDDSPFGEEDFPF